MLQTRRQFLATSLGSATLVSLGLAVPSFLRKTARAADAQAASSGERILVVVQLSGGNDGLNTVVPHGDDEYGRNRFTLNVAGSVHRIDDYHGLHSSMGGFSELLDDGRLAIVQGVGYPNPDRSHFRSMDIWQTADNGEVLPSTGWLGRWLDGAYPLTLPSPPGGEGRGEGGVPALHLGTRRLPLALTAERVRVPSIQSLDSFRLRQTGDATAQQQSAETIHRVAEIERTEQLAALDFIRRSTLAAYTASDAVSEALSNYDTPISYPAFPLAERLRTTAQLIDAGLGTRIYYVSLDGFDTHASQAETHAALLTEFSQSVTAFVRDLEHHGHADRVLVMSFSEFGRRVRENGSGGTDHGVAAPMFLAGGRVQPGLIGDHPSLTDLDSGDLRFHTDFRQVYATILDEWLGFPSADVLGARYEHVPVLASS